MINSNIKRVVSNLGNLKLVRFGLDSNIEYKCGAIPILNSENLFDILYAEYGIYLNIYPDTIYLISLVFICSDNSIKYIEED
jgi:hypothetical protein